MNDTVKLLRECNAGLRMGERAIERILPHVKSTEMRTALEECKDAHAQLGDKTHRLLLKSGADTKPPHPIASEMIDVKIRMMLMIDGSDKTIAGLMTDGCNMGIKSLSHYLNRFTNADAQSKSIARELIGEEDALSTEMRAFL